MTASEIEQRRTLVRLMTRAWMCARSIRWALAALDHGVATSKEREALALVKRALRGGEDFDDVDELRYHVCAATEARDCHADEPVIPEDIITGTGTQADAAIPLRLVRRRA